MVISTSYCPIAWPSPIAATLTVKTGICRPKLPQRKAVVSEEKPTRFKETIAQPTPLETTQLRAFNQKRGIVKNESNGEFVFEINADNGKTRFGRNGLEMGSTSLQRFSIHTDNPASAKAVYEWEWEWK